MKALMINDMDLYKSPLSSSLFKEQHLIKYYHPNRMVFVVPENDPMYTLLGVAGIGQVHEFNDEASKDFGWI